MCAVTLFWKLKTLWPIYGDKNPQYQMTTAHLNIHISNQMVSQVIAHVHLLHLTILFLHFCEDLLQRGEKVCKGNTEAVSC